MIFAALLLAHPVDQVPTASEIVSKMIARYHSAKTVRGEYTATAHVGAQDIVVNCTVQIERPNKMFLRQDVPAFRLRYVVTSDGKTFSYPVPHDTIELIRQPNERLIEDVTAKMTLGDIYHAVSHSIAERSAVLDLVVADMDDLKMLRDQWMSMEPPEEVDLNGEKVYRIVGKWRINRVSQPAANFGMFITKDGDLRKYVLDQYQGVDPVVFNGQQSVRSEVNVSVNTEVVSTVKVGAETDPRLFTVLK